MKFDDNGWLYLGIQKNLIHTISGIETQNAQIKYEYQLFANSI